MFTVVLILLIVIFYFLFTKNHDYWAKRNVKYDKPVPLFGNIYRNVVGKRSIIEISTELYYKYSNEKVVGMYRGNTPELVVRDLDIAKRILIEDFTYFYPRGLARNVKIDPIWNNLFHVDGDTWKLLRQRLTPAFTTAKLKKMFPLVIECAEKLSVVGDDIVKNGGECDVHELMARFTTEFIGACGFGIQMNSINDENSLFRELGKFIFTPNWRRSLLTGIWNLFPNLRTIAEFLLLETNTLETCENILLNIRQQRNYKPSSRNDFVDLLLELETKGKIIGESIENRNPDEQPTQVDLEMTTTIMAAQMFIFFAAGFETSSSATSYLLHELAFHPDIQENIQREIDEVLKNNDNKLCFNSLSEMELLRAAFKEGMRIFPPVGVLNRVCARQYTIPELNITIDPGVKIIIPVQAIQNDEKYFEEPTQFNPERFRSVDTLSHKYAYLPFGEGPRACIGARLGEMQSLAGLAVVLQKFSVEPATSTRRCLEVNHRVNVLQSVVGGVPLKLVRRNPSRK